MGAQSIKTRRYYSMLFYAAILGMVSGICLPCLFPYCKNLKKLLTKIARLIIKSIC